MIQTILFPRKSFTIPEAIQWLDSHKYNHHKIDKTSNFYRFRQVNPTSHSNYYTITLKNGVELVYEKPVI